MSVGMPAHIKLDDFGSHLWAIFGCPAYLVGSAIGDSKTWRDVDIRVILPDAQYQKEGYGHPHEQRTNSKWAAMCLALSVLGKEMTGLPIDFQIQQQTYANKTYEGNREPIGMIGLRIVKSTERKRL